MNYFQSKAHSVPPYNDEELAEALKQYGLALSDIPQSVFTLIRKPRYFDLMVRFRNQMAESGDITPARLIYEDWRDRYERKTNLPLSNLDFQDLIKNIARKNRAGMEYNLPQELDFIPSIHEEKQNILQELVTGNILQNVNGQYRVEPKHLQYAFGLLLAEQVSQGSIEPRDNLDEVIARWFEPQSEMDIKSAICGIAVLHAMTTKDYPIDGQVSLLKWWISAQNPPQEVENSFIAYFPLNPRAYFTLAELVWSDESHNPWCKEIIVRSLMKWRYLEKVKTELIPIFEKWLGFVNRDGYFSGRDKSEEQINEERAKIAERVGRDLTPGKIEIAGYTFTLIEESGLLGLGKVVLAIISHLERAPFIHAISIGCIAEAIMGFPAKYDLFNWILKSSPISLSKEIIQETYHLIEQNTLVTLQAGYRLLTFEGGSDAIKLRQTFPEDIFPTSPLHELYFKDPCNSGFSWQRKHVEQCLDRKDLEARWVAIQLKEFCIDPELQLPKEWPNRLASVVDEINANSLWTHLATTEDQLFLSQVEPTLCAFLPNALVQLIRNTVQNAKNRSELELRQFALSIKQYFPLFGSNERETILEIWSQLQNQSTPWTEMRETAEEALFSLVLQIDTNGDRQLQFLMQRHPGAIDLLSYEGLFKPITDWEIVLHILNNNQDPKLLGRILWFISSSKNVYPQGIHLFINKFLYHFESKIRWLAMMILFKIGDLKYIDPFINSQWSYNFTSHLPLEDHWGSLLLCRFGLDLPYKELRNRVQPCFLGYAVEQRGFKLDEVSQFASDVFRMWQYAEKGIELPVDFPITELNQSPNEDINIFERFGIADEELNSVANSTGRNMYWGEEIFDINQFTSEFSIEKFKIHQEKLKQIINMAIHEQSKAGNELFNRSFPANGLENARKQRPDLFNIMIETVLVEKSNASRTLVLCRGLYETLCGILIKKQTSDGLALYRKLNDKTLIRIVDSETHIRWLDFVLFSGPEEANLITEWDNRITQCTNDQELLELVIITTSGNGKRWLKSRINSGLQSTIQLERARCITILGFLDDDDAGKLLEIEATSDLDTWVVSVAKESLHHWRKNLWAKTWFGRFLTEKDDIKSWAAFRLFLECIDRRYYFWKQQVVDTANIKTGGFDRLLFLESQYDVINNKIKNNEKPIQESFLSQKILREMWPWIRTGD